MPRNKTAATIALEAISKKSGLGIKHLRDLHRESGMPISSTRAALHWLENRPEKSPATSSVEALRLGRLKLVNLQAAKADLDLAARRAELVSRADVREMFSAAGHGIRAGLLSIENDLIAKVSGKSLSEAREIARHELRQVMLKLQDAESEFWREHPLDETKLK